MWFFASPYLWGGLVALIGLNAVRKESVADGEFISNPDFDIPDPDPQQPLIGGKGLTRDKWDDAILGVIVLGLILFSKPWK